LVTGSGDRIGHEASVDVTVGIDVNGGFAVRNEVDANR
jgi:hypothetical protein